jgi:hypothetical protein
MAHTNESMTALKGAAPAEIRALVETFAEQQYE